jgi:hypothetical protein
MLRRSFLATPLLAAPASPKFQRVFSHDKDRVSSGFTDFAMFAPGRGIALGTQATLPNGRPQGLAVSTEDDGKTWTESNLNFLPISLHARDALLWAVASNQDLWFSAEGGRDWRKISKVRNCFRVHFIDDQTGYAVGFRKTVLRTTDGGRKWSPLPEAAKIDGDPDTTAFVCVASAGQKMVSIFGNTQSRRLRRFDSVPDWMDPESAKRDFQVPSLTIALDSNDGGKTFRPSRVSAFGNIHRVRTAPGGQGFILVKFGPYFPYGGELYRFRAQPGATIERLYRSREYTLHDFLSTSQGLYLAATQRSNNSDLPIPTPVKILFSENLTDFREIPVDYRAEANSVFLSLSDTTPFAATDEGMILKLT